MAGPWERYKQAPSEGPWTKFAQPGPEATDALSKTRVVSGGILEGIPVLGPIIRGGVDRAAAATMAPFSDKDYGEILKIIQAGTEEEKTANPILDRASQITGAVAGTVPMIMAAPAAFGAGGGSLIARSGASALTGAGLGGADAAVRSGGDLEAMKNGVKWGGALGVAGPIAGDILGAGTRAIASRFSRKAPSVAQRDFARAAEADAADPVKLADLGGNAMPMDLGPNLQRQAGALASKPGEAQQTVRSAVKARDAAANQRIRSTLDDTLGPPPIPSRVEAQITSGQRSLDPSYRAAFRDARPVDVKPVAEYLNKAATLLRGEAQRQVLKVRSMLNRVGAEGLETRANVIFEARKAIDAALDEVTNSNARSALTTARSAVDDVLADAVPGLKEVDAQFAELARQKEALQRGQTVLSSGREAPRPAELAEEFQRGAQPQGRMVGPSAVPVRLREGARAEIERIVGTNANDRVALQRLIKGEGDWNRARLSTLFGSDKAKRIIDLLDREKVFAETSDVVTRNSETAARLAAQAEIGSGAKPAGVLESAGNLGFGTAARRMGDKVFDSARSAAQQQSNAELARLLTSRDPVAMTRAIRLVQEARRRGDITAQASRDMLQSMMLGGSQERRPLGITVGRPR